VQQKKLGIDNEVYDESEDEDDDDGLLLNHFIKRHPNIYWGRIFSRAGNKLGTSKERVS
jgi:hypothetical protein